MAGNRWTILAVLFLARTAMGFQFQAVASTGAVPAPRSPYGLCRRRDVDAIQSLGPAIAGLLREAFGTAATPIWLAAGLTAGIVPLLGMFETLAVRAQAMDAQ